MIKKRSDFNPNPEPYCTAKFEPKENNVICYTHTKEGTKRLMFRDREEREECKTCPQLTEAVNRLIGYRGWR